MGHYAIGALALLMLAGILLRQDGLHVPEWLAGLIALVPLRCPCTTRCAMAAVAAGSAPFRADGWGWRKVLPPSGRAPWIASPLPDWASMSLPLGRFMALPGSKRSGSEGPARRWVGARGADPLSGHRRCGGEAHPEGLRKVALTATSRISSVANSSPASSTPWPKPICLS